MIYFFLLLFCPIIADGLTINIVGWNNGVGLEQDANILKKELAALGHQTQYIDYHDEPPYQVADINLFLEHANKKIYPYATKNYFIPNPEWCDESPEELLELDMILCKTYETYRIYSKYHPNLYLLGFTSVDRYDPSVPKDYRKPIHTRGKSAYKNSRKVLYIWNKRPKFPMLTFTQSDGKYKSSSKNITFINDHLPFHEFIRIQNSNGIHLCPSEVEGFGHYLNEAMSTKAVVITTDAPPMNEFIQDKRFLVKVADTRAMRYGIKYRIDPKHLGKVFSKVRLLSLEELHRVGERNRQAFLERDQQFRKRLKALFE